MGNSEGSTTADSSPLGTAADRIRDSAKWLLAAFGAAGAAVVTGVSLGDLGDVQGADLCWAMLAIVGALVGVAMAISAAGSVVTKSFATLRDIVEDDAKSATLDDPILFQGLGSLSNLNEAYMQSLVRLRNAQVEFASSPSSNDQRTVDKARVEVEAAGQEAAFYSSIAAGVITRQSFLQVRDAYARAKRWMALGALIAIVGLVIFVAIATRTSDAALPIVGTLNSPVIVDIKPHSLPQFAADLGDECNGQAIGGTAVATEGTSVVVVTERTVTCERAMLSFSPDQAIVRTTSDR